MTDPLARINRILQFNYLLLSDLAADAWPDGTYNSRAAQRIVARIDAVVRIRDNHPNIRLVCTPTAGDPCSDNFTVCRTCQGEGCYTYTPPAAS